MTDSHCHLDYCDDPATAADPDLRALISVGTTLARSRQTIMLAETFPNVFAAVGIHPNTASEADTNTRAAIEGLARHPRVVAIGETGFDTYWDKETLGAQRAAFLWQADLAERLKKPLILHVRDKDGRDDASSTAAAALLEVGYRQGVLHCFNGHRGLLEAGRELGWYVSFAGNLTYKSATVLHEAARSLPRERLLVETDSPYLAPMPLRGKRNVPGNVRYTARFLADLRGEDPADVEAYTDANAAALYGLNA